jgi:divalent metal cation (Fe/Co/Zn/Cd) transporter
VCVGRKTTGSYSYGLLVTALSASSSPALTQAAEVLANVSQTDLSQAAAGHSHSHSHSHDHSVLDPNAAWFALASVIIKETLYRASKSDLNNDIYLFPCADWPQFFGTALRVAKEEHSNVLVASAYHHRSDAYGSAIALVAIVRTPELISSHSVLNFSVFVVIIGG